MSRTNSRRAAAAVLATCLVLATAPAARAKSPGVEYGQGAICVFANLLYGPAKFIYATGGALVAGVAYAFSAGDAEVARPIVDASLRGDYVITPSHLERKKSLEFIGQSPEQKRARERADDSGWGSAPPPARDDGVIEEGF